jgi:3-hydroxyacyl-CoA dehydrogenase/enoyl-CoA hydratase/3-hydroxybutyryl-CoA epimerase
MTDVASRAYRPSQPQAADADRNALAMDVATDGVATITFDRRDSRANILTTGVMQQLDRLIEDVENGAREARIRALILRSGKPGMFIAGANVDEIMEITDAADGEAKARAGQRVFTRIEQLPIPTIVAITGVCLGGGTELALACSYRIAANSPDTKIGLPEVQLGILPGFGGTVRLPRLVGVQAALPIILTGKPVDARKALRIGLIDEMVPPPMLDEYAIAVAHKRIAAQASNAKRERRAVLRVLGESPPGRQLMLWQARRQVMKETRGKYPAPLAALDTIAATAGKDLAEALAIEARALGRLVVTDVSKNLIHVFRLMEAAKKAAPAAKPVPVEHVAVVGAGVMGGGIAQLLAYRDLSVRMKDIRADALGHGLRTARELFEKMVASRRLDRRTAGQKMDHIAPALDFAGFGAVDLVIEAVVERMDVKKSVLAETEALVPKHCILTSNTSTLSITEMQRGLERPQSFCGMHFFNPVHRMPLVEIVRGAESSDSTISSVFALARRLDKTPLVVQDGPGFLVNRLLSPYLNEAGWLLKEGASIEQVDRAMLDFGMPMGPFRLLDEVGLDVARHAAGVLHEAFGERMQPAPPLVALQQTKRLGKKGNSGFYRYENGRDKGVDESVYGELGPTIPAARREIPAEVIRERCLLAMINEAALVLEDGIVSDAGQVDLGMITGTGFPPFRGGVLRYADTWGIRVILDRLVQLEQQHGVRFRPAQSIRDRAAAQRNFYA